MTDDDEVGTAEERVRVRSAFEILVKFNRELDALRALGIKCRLIPFGNGYSPEFTQTKTIVPSDKKTAPANYE